MRRLFNNLLLPSRRSGFSLVEIMIAMAVIAIGLIAIVGLIPQGVQSARDAADNTLAATIVHDTFSSLRQQALVSATFPPTVLQSSPIPDVYYDVAGTNAYLAPSADTYYDVHLTSQLTPNLVVTVNAMVTWPVKVAGAKPINTNFFSTSIANYQH